MPIIHRKPSNNSESDFPVLDIEPVPGYESLQEILKEAYDQAARGKGAERHAGGQTFDNQPMQTISDLFNTPKGMAFQAVKKLREGLELPTVERQERELLGAINYIAGIIIYLRKNEAQ